MSEIRKSAGAKGTGLFIRIGALASSFITNRAGSYAVYGAIAAFPLVVGAAVVLEYTDASRLRSELQQVLDASVLAGAREDTRQVQAAEQFFHAYFGDTKELQGGIKASFELGDGVLDGTATRPMEMSFGMNFLTRDSNIGVKSQARFVRPDNSPCITVLADAAQALLVNSGAKVDAAECEIHVHSQKNPAMIMNAGSRLDIEKLCVRGKNIIHNGGTISRLETNCAVQPDPYAGRFPEPVVPNNCTTSGVRDGSRHTLKPGLHCGVIFNGSPTITFEPGLHIIKDSMIVNSGSTVVAEGVTFYFPDTDSKIQANGQLRMTATAPTSGPYKGVLMFEKTSDPANNSRKRQYVFNGSLSEHLEGIIYLPNRDVTYNSKTNVQASRIALVVNTMIVNSADWKFQGYGSGGGTEKIVYLSR